MEVISYFLSFCLDTKRNKKIKNKRCTARLFGSYDQYECKVGSAFKFQPLLCNSNDQLWITISRKEVGV
jgi:hypothetical protein